jgi:hypothetical protein
MRVMRGFLLAGVCALSACATGPVPVAGVPGANKDPAGFQKDELACRTEAGQAVYPAAPSNGSKPVPISTNSNAQWQTFFTRYAQCQTAKGNSVVAIPWAAAYADYLGYFSPAGYGYGAPAYADGYGYGYGYGYPGAYADPFFYDDAFFLGDPFLFGGYGPFFSGYGYGYGRFGYGRFGYGRFDRGYGGHYAGGGSFGHFGGGFHGGGGGGGHR